MATYATLAELKARLGIGDTVDDTMLTDALNAASREIENWTGRVFAPTTEARVFAPTSRDKVRFGQFCDLVSASVVATDDNGDGTFETTWSAGDYQLGPANPNAAPEPRPYQWIRAVGSRLFPAASSVLSARTDTVQVTGTWGWASVPSAVKEACLLLAAEGFKAKDSPFGVAGVADFGVIRIRDNALARRKLQPYARAAGGVMVG